VRLRCEIDRIGGQCLTGSSKDQDSSHCEDTEGMGGVASPAIHHVLCGEMRVMICNTSERPTLRARFAWERLAVLGRSAVTNRGSVFNDGEPINALAREAHISFV
jgi:hypothetical protein